MTDQKPALPYEQQRVNTAQYPTVILEPPLTESNLVVTGVLVVIAFLLLGPVVLISCLFLVIAFIKLKDEDYEKAISYNRIARITAVIFLVAGIILIVIPILLVIIYVVVVIPIIFGIAK
eukprot:TRINITY_DN9317_c0_g1_i1.p1 TRINITY_DN9317_c0_g1~~TRINITY_DN9317_c0_g1_i1.p1  ORF type:complete len:120 (+),score=9.67 TRINITY_DN9317_c0_g1_i1:64-423(+)